MVIYENLPRYCNMDSHQAIYVCSKEVRSRKRFGVCAYPGSHYELLNQESALKIWLNELQSLTEVESLNALQAKSVATTPESFEALSIRNAQVAIQQIRKNSSTVIDELDSLIDSLPVSIEGLGYLFEAFHETYLKMHSVIETCRRKGCDFATNKQLSTDVISICEQTLKFMSAFLEKGNINNAQIEANVRKLKESFGELVDVTIKKECSILITSLNKKTSHLCLKWSLLALWQLTQKDPYMCRLFIENQNIIRYLLDIVQNYCQVSLKEVFQIKAAALRVLTYLSSNRDAIKQILDQIISNKCLTSIALNESEDVILKETVGLLVQLTTPFIDSKEKTHDAIWNVASKSLVNELVHCLTEIVRNTSNNQIFLMASAALANITFLNTEALVKFETLSILVNASKQRQQFEADLLLQDQIITLLANMAQKHPLEVVSSGGLIFLLNALHSEVPFSECCSEPGREQAIARIQQKIAVAIARLGTNKSCSKIILKLNGVAKLVHLCKDPRERNNSDTVLLASIAALKRLSQSIGRAPFKELNATDLIDLKLQNSFYQYSARNESLV